jgi:glycosyltransferase involved in cell wall biosynthesis
VTKTTRPRLLFVGAFPPPGRNIFGGHVTACRTLLESSFPRHFELDLIDSTQISNPPPTLLTRLFIAAFRSCRFLWRIERRRPDVVLLFFAIGASVIEKCTMAWYARLRGVPAVLFPRGGSLQDRAARSPAYRSLLRIAFAGGKVVFCQSARSQSFVVDVLGFAPERAPVIMNWTATAELLSVGRERHLRAIGPLHLVFVGWIETDKGVFDLLEALHQLETDRPYSIDFIGDGKIAAEAAALARKWGLEERVRFRGWLSGESLRDALAAADIFVLPSWEEGLPNAMIEAFAAKIAVVVTEVGGIPDVAHDGVNALVVPPRNVGELRRALTRLMENDALRMQLANAGFATAERDFGIEAAVVKLVCGLESAMASHHRSQISPAS